MLRPYSSSLVQLLQGVDAAILEEAKRHLAEAGQRKRIFDTFPCLLPSNSIHQLRDHFRRVLAGIPAEYVVMTDDGPELQDARSRRRIMSFEKEIINITCTELLDGNDNIKPEILDVLQWDKVLKDEEVFDVICAFVGAINQEVIYQEEGVSPHMLAAVCAYITCHYGDWIKEVLDRPKLAEPSFPISDPALVGLGLLALGIGAGVAFYGLPSSSRRGNDYSVDDEFLIPSPKNQF